ncbi:MAG: aspartate-semialdehyde dehydrogenase [Chloroflexota bacterium]
MNRIPVTILGATGMVGQRFISLLKDHPWFQVTCLAASEGRAGQPYEDSVRWQLDDVIPEAVRRLPLQTLEEAVDATRLVFSALPSDLARQWEPVYAKEGSIVCSNASAFRMEDDVPLLMPEVNPDHVQLLEIQRHRRGWRGAILTNPNCTSSGLTVALRALQQACGVRRVFAVSLQALSGAGYPGVPSLDVTDNVIPYIAGEEEKVESEPLKMLGTLEDARVRPAPILISAHTNRVAVRDGHTVCAGVELEQSLTPEQAMDIFRAYQAPAEARDLPSAPQPPIRVREEPDRPQPRRDRMEGNGMTTVVGRVRKDPLFHVKFVVLSHNTIRGAAGASIYNAELLARQGWFKGD